MGDLAVQGGKKKRVITRNIGVPLRSKGVKILVAGFEVDKTDLLIDPDHNHQGMLNDLINWIKNSPNVSIIGLEGRASETGPHKNNLWLSIERAHVVQRYLRTQGQIIVKDSQMVYLGDKFPLEKATSPGPGGKEIAANRSVMIYIKHPPVAVARALDEQGYEFLHVRSYGEDNISPKQITLDSTKSRPCEGFPIVSYLWEQIENTDPQHDVCMEPLHSSVKPDEVYSKRTDRSDAANPKFKLYGELLGGKYFLALYFRLTVTDVNQLSGTATLRIPIERVGGRRPPPSGPNPQQWGLKMLGSVSLTALGKGVTKYLGPVETRGMLGVGGMFALGLLKKKTSPPAHILCFFGLGGGFTIGASKGKNALFDGLKLPAAQNLLKIKKLKEILDFLGIDIDAPWEDYTKFTCTHTDYDQFDNSPAALGAAGVSGSPIISPIFFFIGAGYSIGVLDFLSIDTNPERIDIGGVNFIKAETTIGVEAKGNVGLVKVFSSPGFVEFLDNVGWKT